MIIDKTLRIAAASLLLILAGCEKEPESRTKVKAQFDVDTLFTKDGCTVFRFYDAGNFRYFTKCGERTVDTEWSESCGKNCSRRMTVTGDNRP